MKTTIVWTMTADTAMEFFQRCTDRKAETEDERMAVLVELMEEGKMTSVVATDKSKEEYIQDKAKHFKILEVGTDETN